MNTVVIGWNPGEDKKKWKAFTGMMEKIFISIKTDSFETDKKHIRYAVKKEEVDALIEGCSVLVCTEELDGQAMGTGTFKAWKEKAPDGLKVITVLDGNRYGGGKCRGLYDNGFFDALFEKDFTQKGLSSIITASRTEDEAFAYYGLDGYVAPKKRSARKKKAVKDGSSVEAAVTPEAESAPAFESTAETVKEEAGTEEKAAEVKEAAEDAPSGKKGKRKKKEPSGKTEPGEKAPDKESGIVPVEMGVKGEAEDSTPKTAQDEPAAVQEEAGENAAVESPALDNASSVEENSLSVEPGNAGTDMVETSESTEPMEPEGEEVEEDPFRIFTFAEESLMAYLNDCDTEAHSYVRPFPELSKADQMLEQLLDYYTVQNNTWIQNVNNNAQVKDQFEAELWQRIAGNDLDLTASEKETVFNEFSRFMWRYDILEPYILDPDISDIKVYDPWTVQIKVMGKKMAAPTTFRSNLHYRGFIGRIARKNHVDINNKALARFADTLTYSEVRLRGNIATELLNCNGSPLIHIRKVNNTKFTTEKLIALRMMTPATAAYLVWCIRNKKSIVFCGKGSSGKTTITNWLIDFFPLWLSALCIQEIDELYSVTHPYIQFQQITSDIELLGDDEGRQKYTLRDLAINGLLTDIDAFLIGEIKGPEALQFTNSANTGNQCLCTVHAEHEREALPQIADYSKFGSDYSRADLLKRLTSIDVVVFMKDFQVKSISEVAGWDEERQDIVYRGVPITVPEKISVAEKHKIMGAERRLFRGE